MNERCEAKKRNGELCQKFPIQGRTKCRLHGGSTPRGVASVHFKHGKYCSRLPPRLKQLYEETGRPYEAQTLSCQSELRLIDTLLSDLTGSLGDSGDNTEMWAKILGVVENRRKLVETESKRQATNHEGMSKADITVFLEELMRVLKEVLFRRVEKDIAQDVLTEFSETFIRVQALVMEQDR